MKYATSVVGVRGEVSVGVHSASRELSANAGVAVKAVVKVHSKQFLSIMCASRLRILFLTRRISFKLFPYSLLVVNHSNSE